MISPADGSAWIRDEPQLREWMVYLVGRGLRRPILVAAVTLTLVAGVLVPRTRKASVYTGSATMRIAEGLRSEAAPTTPAMIGLYVWRVALTRTNLIAIMKKYHISADPTAQQVDLFRDRLDVGVSANSFDPNFELVAEGEPRSVLVHFEFMDGDKERARGVIEDLTNYVVETTRAMRATKLQMQRDTVDAAKEQARLRIEELDDEMGRLAAGGGPDAPDLPTRQAMIADVETVKANFVQRMTRLNQLAAASDFAEGAEKTGLGMQFDVVDEDVDVQGQPMGPRTLAALAIILIGIIGPICLITVGAFDRRVYSRDDLVQPGFPILGVLPRFREERRKK